MKYRQFKLSVFTEILLIIQQVNVVLCDSQVLFSKNSDNKSQIDLECFGNHSSAITTDVYKYIFPPGSGLSKLGVLQLPNNYQNENSDNFIFLEFLNKDIGFACLPFNKSLPSINGDHQIFSKRIKRNSNASNNTFYTNQRITLRCFDVKEDSPHNAITSWKWEFTDGTSLSETDYYDENTKYDLGEKPGDFILKNYTGKAVNVSCKAEINGKPIEGNSYQLVTPVLPDYPFIEFNGTRLPPNFDGKVGCYNFTCKSLNGRPDPELSFSFGDTHSKPVSNSTIGIRICIADTDNGAYLICNSTHMGIGGNAWEKLEKIKINVIASGLSGGIIAVIVIISLLVILAVAGFIAYMWRKKHALNKEHEYAIGEVTMDGESEEKKRLPTPRDGESEEKNDSRLE